MKRIIRDICIYVALLLTVYAKADVKMASIFADQMVLQRAVKLPVWGWADTNEAVSVQFAGQTVQTHADSNGNWRVTLEPVISDDPQIMIVTGKNTIRINDILMGEVWICSGQSNMAVPIREGYDAAREIAAANYPKIRVYEVEHRICPEPDRTLGGEWKICSPATAAELTAVGYFFAREIYEKLGVPVGLVHTSWGGTPGEAWTDWNALKNNPKLGNLIERFEFACREYPKNEAAFEATMKDWECKAKIAQEAGITPPPQPFITPMGPMHFQRPSGLYNGMVLSIVPYATRGVIWYQGECNAGRPREYFDILPTMIDSWRTVWDRADLPFYIVQISSWSRLQDNPNEISGWAMVRDAQAQTADKLANCHLVVTTDIGDADTNHPKNKQDVGKRLALAALANEYGHKDLPYEGPKYKTMIAENGRLRLYFDKTEGQLVSKLTGFVVAGEDLVYEWADAHIDGNTITISSPKVPNPVAVRYAWASNPPCSLYNKAGLPAVPFQAQLPGICVVNASEDTYLDEGSPDKNFGHHMDLRIEDEGSPGSRRHILIRWDLSKIDVDEIDKVILRVTQTDGHVGDGIEIYAITEGDWSENDITWNMWQTVNAKLDFLGIMLIKTYPDGLSTFSNEALTDYVRRWLANEKQNRGLLLKYHYNTVYTGDTLFAAGAPEAFYDPPQLVIHTALPRDINTDVVKEK